MGHAAPPAPPAAPTVAPAAPAPAGASKKESSARIAELFGYTAESNPFGDSNLHDTFVWRKKIEKEVATGVRTAAPTKAEHRRERDNLMSEIERARERRVQREREREETERLRAEEARLKDAEQYHNWEAKEEEFHLAQVRQRSVIRMREARERPVDILAKNILLIEMCEKGEDTDDANRLVAMDVELNEPGVVLSALPLAELEALLVDVERFIVLEGDDGRYRRFWTALRIATVDLIDRATVRAAAESAAAASGAGAADPAIARATANEAVAQEIDAMFEGKSEDVLGDMEESVRETIRRGLGAAAGGGGGGAAIDVDYWERVLRHLKAAQARQALRRMHEELLAVRLGQLECKRDALGAAAAADAGAASSAYADSAAAAGSGAPRSYSPSLEPDLLPAGSLEAADGAAAAGDLLQRRLEALRRQGVLPEVQASLQQRLNPVGPGAGDAVDEMMQPYLDNDGRALPMGLTEVDMGGGAEVVIPAIAAAALAERNGAPAAPDGLSAPEALMWQEKWRPRKPRYFNRVRTGYDWNRYNQAHCEGGGRGLACVKYDRSKAPCTPPPSSAPSAPASCRRPRQPPAQDRPGLQVQHLLPRPARPRARASLLPRARRLQGVRHHPLPRRATV